MKRQFEADRQRVFRAHVRVIDRLAQLLVHSLTRDEIDQFINDMAKLVDIGHLTRTIHERVHARWTGGTPSTPSGMPRNRDGDRHRQEKWGRAASPFLHAIGPARH